MRNGAPTGPARMKVAAAAVGIAALTGCGTTVAGVNGESTGAGFSAATNGGIASPVQSGVAQSASTAPVGLAAGTGGASGTGGSGALSPSAGSGSGANSPTRGATASTGKTSAPTGNIPGVTATSVSIGIYTIDSSYAAAAKNVLGPAGDLGNLAKYYQDLAANFNATKTLAGRKLQLVLRTLAPTSTDQASQDQSACTTFTQDQPVLGVITDVSSPTLVACTSKAGIPTVQTGANFDANALQSTPYLVLPISATMNRFIPPLVSSLSSRGFFTPGVTPTVVGVLYDDMPAYQRAYSQVLVPALHAAGVTQIVEATSAYPSNDQIGTSSTDISNAVLRFRSSNVTRVLFLSTSAWEPSSFMNDAAAQHYTPRYGLSSQNYPYSVSTLVADKSQLSGSLGVGWLPPADVAQQDDPVANTQGRRDCMAVLQKAGDQPSSSTAYTDATLVCDQFNAVVAAALAPAGLNGRGGLFDAMVGSKTGFQPNASFASTLAPNRHDGAAAWEPLSWESCGCFRYGGGEQSL